MHDTHSHWAASFATPISDGEASKVLTPKSRLPRRRKPVSRKEAGQTIIEAQAIDAKSLRGPASIVADGHASTDTHSRRANAVIEPCLDAATNQPLLSIPEVWQSSESDVTGAVTKSFVLPTSAMPSAFGHTISVIRELHRQRQDLLRAEGDMTRRIKAICRRSVGYNPFALAKEKREKMAQANAMYNEIQHRSGLSPAEIQRTHVAADAESDLEDGEGQYTRDAQVHLVDADPHPVFENGGGHRASDTPPKDAADVLTPSGEGDGQKLTDLQDWYAAPFAAPVLVDSQHAIYRSRMEAENLLKKQVKSLPIHAMFVKQVNGFGEVGFGQIIGEAGDLSLYANPAKLWKRMGLGLVDGERQRKCVDARKAAAHGYSPIRRSIMFTIGDSLLKKQGPYRELYLARKVYEAQKAEAHGLSVVAAGDIPDGKSKEECMTLMHIHRRAQRYMEKRLLRDLWKAWRLQ